MKSINNYAILTLDTNTNNYTLVASFKYLNTAKNRFDLIKSYTTHGLHTRLLLVARDCENHIVKIYNEY